jgi:hypothetical protein
VATVYCYGAFAHDGKRYWDFVFSGGDEAKRRAFTVAAGQEIAIDPIGKMQFELDVKDSPQGEGMLDAGDPAGAEKLLRETQSLAEKLNRSPAKAKSTFIQAVTTPGDVGNCSGRHCSACRLRFRVVLYSPNSENPPILHGAYGQVRLGSIA